MTDHSSDRRTCFKLVRAFSYCIGTVTASDNQFHLPSRSEPYSGHISGADSVFENSSRGIIVNQVNWYDYLENVLSLPDDVDSGRDGFDLHLSISLEDLEVPCNPS